MPQKVTIAVFTALACLLVQPPTVSSAKPAKAAKVIELRYDVAFAGEIDEELEELLKQVSRLHALQDDVPSSLSVLRSRAERDVESLSAVLRSQGYYDGSITTRIDSSQRPLLVTVRVEQGPVYQWTRFDVTYDDDAPADARERVDALRETLPLGSAAIAEVVLAAEAELAESLARQDFPFAQVAGRKAIVDHATQELALEIRVLVGPRAVFGPVLTEGADLVDEAFIQRRVTWQAGTPWDSSEADRTRRRLTETGLFSSVRVEPADAVEADGGLPVTVRVEESKHRSVGLGVGYSSNEGTGFSAFWEHRNLFGGGERLRFALKISELEQSLRATYREPDFLDVNQLLLLDGGYTHEDTDAYDSRKVSASIGVERRLTDYTTLRGGLALEHSEVTEQGELQESFFLVGTPVQLRRDSSNDLLDPTTGSRFEINAVPYLKALGSEEEFYIVRATHTAYLPLDDDRRYLMAGRLSLGSISGAARSLIPADKRFYAGGGGSIRGYGYQLVGPLDADSDPVGGRSLLETGLEFRIRLTETLGLVPFIEGGNVFERTVPDFNTSLLWGAGIGLRYFTAVGPIRVDVGIPLDRRDGIDDAFQFYISLGQAF